GGEKPDRGDGGTTAAGTTGSGGSEDTGDPDYRAPLFRVNDGYGDRLIEIHRAIAVGREKRRGRLDGEPVPAGFRDSDQRNSACDRAAESDDVSGPDLDLAGTVPARAKISAVLRLPRAWAPGFRLNLSGCRLW